MEVALGAVPIFFTACQGFVVLLDKIHLLRHYKKEIQWLHTKVDVQSRCFKGEIHHLVIETLDAHMAQSLITDDNHAHWKSRDLEDTFRQYMGKLFSEFVLAMQEVHQALAHIQAKLAVFAPLDVKSPLFKATRDKFRIAFKKDEYKEDINSLKEWIAEFKRVRKLAAFMAKKSLKREKKQQLDKLHKDQPGPAFDDSAHYAAVKQYKAIRCLSSGFQAFIQEQWSCCQPSHTQHTGRLFLSSSQKRTSITWLLESNGRFGYTTKLSNRLLFNVSSQLPTLLTPDSETKFFEGYEVPRSAKRQRLSPQPFVPVDYIAAKTEPVTTPTTALRVSNLPLNQTMPSLCKQLEQISLNSEPHQRPLTRIDVNSQELYRFEPQRAPPISAISKGKPNMVKQPSNFLETISTWDLHEVKPCPLSHLLVHSPHHVMLDRERLQLAAALVRATLMSHSTPAWPGQEQQDDQQTYSWSDGCLLNGISFLSKGSIEITDGGLDVQTLLETLNISNPVGTASTTTTTITGKSDVPTILPVSSNNGDDADMTDVADININANVNPNPTPAASLNPSSSTTTNLPLTKDELEDRYGVRNPTLYRLGVALLSIGLWKRIGWQDFVGVRRKVRALDWGGGGSKYRAVVKRLIDSDFGVGTADLHDERVQVEVVKTILDPLEKMVGLLSRTVQQGGGGGNGTGGGRGVLSSENLKSHHHGYYNSQGALWLGGDSGRMAQGIEPEKWMGSVQQFNQNLNRQVPVSGPSDTWNWSSGMAGHDDGEFQMPFVESP